MDDNGREVHGRLVTLALVFGPFLVELAAPTGLAVVVLPLSLAASAVVVGGQLANRRPPGPPTSPGRRVGDRA